MWLYYAFGVSYHVRYTQLVKMPQIQQPYELGDFLNQQMNYTSKIFEEINISQTQIA